MRYLMQTFCLTLTILISASAMAAEKRPNILFAFADDWGRYASIYAQVDGPGSLNDVLRTPHLDRVGREGAVFTRAFVAAPSCTPSRAAVTTGHWFFNCGRSAFLHTPDWRSDAPDPYAKLSGWPLMLKTSGYHIGFTGKTTSKAGRGNAYSKAGDDMHRWSQLLTAAQDKAAARKKILDEVRNNFRHFLANRQSDQPFMYWFGPHHTHRAWVKGSGKKLWGINPDDLKGKLPSFLPDVHAVREDIADYLGEVQAWDAMIGVLLDELQQADELDNTLVLLSGDHGMPGMPNAKCNLYDFGTNVALVARWPGHIKPGRTVDDMVNLMDLAPTFLETGGLTPPSDMPARSFMNVLRSEKSGQIDPSRDHVILGQERHVAFIRENNFGYPKRAIRTGDFLYIRNFAPDRWPMGDPFGITATSTPPIDKVDLDTFVTLGDIDASPTKTWLIQHRNDPKIAPYYNMAFGKRPAEELYDLKTDPDQIKNIASNPAYSNVKNDLAGRLMKTLYDANDPRVFGNGDTFDQPPYVNPDYRRKQQ